MQHIRLEAHFSATVGHTVVVHITDEDGKTTKTEYKLIFKETDDDERREAATVP